MSKVLMFLRVSLVLTVAALVGCGGGGGSSTGGDPLSPDDTSRTITGTVVNDSGANVANAVISIGTYSATSDESGSFRVGPIPNTADISYVFSVDASGAGTGYNRTDLVTYNGQQHNSDEIDTPVGVRNADTNNLGTITVRYSTDGMPSIPFPDKDTILAGRVVRSDANTTGIAGVIVTFGTASVFHATTGRNGYFALNVGRNVGVADLFYGALVFSIDTSRVSPAIPADRQVKYNGEITSQTAIAVSDDISGAGGTPLTTNMGIIQVDMGNGFGSSGGGGSYPPGIPDDPYTY